MADINVSVSRPAVSASVSVNPPPNIPVDVTVQRRQVNVAVVATTPSQEQLPFPGSGDYPEASTNETLQALIDRKLERSAVTGMRNLVLFFENKLA